MAQETVSFERWKWIGGSDIPIIMSISPWKTRWQLLKEKAQIEESEFHGNIYTEFGNIMEPKIRDHINAGLGFDFQEGKAEGGDIRIHTDGEDIMKDTILEVKTTSHIKECLDDYKDYLVQLLFYMNERNMRFGILAVYERPEDLNTDFDPNRLMTYPVTIDDYRELIGEIYEEVDSFREDLKKLRANPFLTEEELIPDDVRIVARMLIAIKEAEQAFKEFTSEKETLISKLGELYEREHKKTAEIGGYKVTYTAPKEGTKKTVETTDYEKLKQVFPTAYTECVKVEEKMGTARKANVTLTRLKE